MRHLDVVDQRTQCPLEAVEAGRRVGRLAGLVIFAAEDHEVVVAMRFDPEIVIRVGGVPEQRVGNPASVDRAPDDVRGVQTRVWSGTTWRWPYWRCRPGDCEWRSRRTRT